MRVTGSITTRPLPVAGGFAGGGLVPGGVAGGGLVPGGFCLGGFSLGVLFLERSESFCLGI